MWKFTPPHLAFAIFLLWLTSSLGAWGQAPANDNPCGAVVLTPSGQLCTMPTVSGTQGSTTTPDNGYSYLTSCDPQQQRDVWFKFTTTGSGLGSNGATLTVAGNAAGMVRLFSASSCAGPFTPLACSATTTSNAAAPPLITTALTANTTYYVQVGSNFSTQPGPFTVCLTDGPGFVMCPPLAVGGPVYSNPNNTAATITFGAQSYHVLPYTVTIRTDTADTLPGLPIQVITTYTTTTSPLVLTGLVPGHMYQVTINAYCVGGGGSGGGVSFTVPAPNDDPCGAFPLPVNTAAGCVPMRGSVGGATLTIPNGYTNPGCGGPDPSLGMRSDDVWYTFRTAPTGPASTAVTVTVSNFPAAGQLRLFAGSGCSGPLTEITCTASTTRQGAPALTATNLLPNTQYFVSVTFVGPYNLSGIFDICASAVPPVLPCPTPLQFQTYATVLSPTSAGFVIQLPAGSRQPPTYTITYTAAGGIPQSVTFSPNLYNPTDPYQSIVFLTGLLPNTTYTAVLVANCPGGPSAPVTVTFTTPNGPVPPAPGPPPANDACATATVLPVGTTCHPLTGTTLGATVAATDPQPTCVGDPPTGDVWYRLTMPASGSVEVHLDTIPGSTLRHQHLALYSGSCGSLYEEFCGLGGYINLLRNVVARVGGAPGSTLYARVWSDGTLLAPGGLRGIFNLCAVDTPPACPPATGLAVTNITTTSVSVSFVPGAGNTFIQARAVPVGGGQVVATVGLTSPLTLTGLRPGTAYVVTLLSRCGANTYGPDSHITITTLPLPVTCPAPAGFYGGNVVSTTASVSFTPMPGTTYVLTYTAAGGPTQTLPVTASPVLLTGLLPNTRYTLSLQATCAVGPAPLATTAFTTTNGCPAPLFVAVAAISSTAATISFTAPAGATGYVAILTPQSGSPRVVTPAPTASPFTLTGLTPGTGYALSLLSTCAGPLASTDAAVRFVTLIPVATCVAPAGVLATSLSATTASVSFAPVPGAMGYTLTLTPTTGTTGSLVVTSGTTLPIALTGLLPGTAYTLTVATSCGAATTSAPSAGTGFTTPLASRSAALAAQVGLFPNPASRSATLTVPAGLRGPGATVRLLNALGQLVRQQPLAATAATALDLAGLPAGLYSLWLNSPEGPLVKRLVVE